MFALESLRSSKRSLQKGFHPEACPNTALWCNKPSQVWPHWLTLPQDETSPIKKMPCAREALYASFFGSSLLREGIWHQTPISWRIAPGKGHMPCQLAMLKIGHGTSHGLLVPLCIEAIYLGGPQSRTWDRARMQYSIMQ